MLSDAAQQDLFNFINLKWLEVILRYIYWYKYSYIYKIFGILGKISHYYYYFANYHIYYKLLYLLILFDILSWYYQILQQTSHDQETV